MTLPVLEADPAEEVMSKIEAATGVRPVGCPFRATLDPFVVRVSRAHRGWKNGHEIHEMQLRAGVEAFDAALNVIEAHDLRAERAKRDSENKPRGPTTSVGRRPGKRR